MCVGLQYLGELEEEGQIPMEDEETTPTLPLLCLPDRVLFPGETLPMHVQNPHVRLGTVNASHVTWFLFFMPYTLVSGLSMQALTCET